VLALTLPFFYRPQSTSGPQQLVNDTEVIVCEGNSRLKRILDRRLPPWDWGHCMRSLLLATQVAQFAGMIADGGIAAKP
jgi:hypothetical protein